MKVIQELSGLIKWLQSVRSNKKITTNARHLGSIPIGIFRKAPHLIVLCCRLTVIENAFEARYVRLWDAIAARYVRLLRCHCGPIRSVIVTAVVARYVRLLLLPLWPDTFGYWFCRCGPIRSVIDSAVAARYVRLLILPLWPDTFGYCNTFGYLSFVVDVDLMLSYFVDQQFWQQKIDSMAHKLWLIPTHAGCLKQAYSDTQGPRKRVQMMSALWKVS